jgi:hypothetical protein
MNMMLEDADEFFLSMAVFSAFIDKGMRACPEFRALAANAFREREIVDGMACLVPLVVRLERVILAAGISRIRVGRSFEQDVCEPFGAWYVRHLSENGGNEHKEVCRSQLAHAVIDYFVEGQTPLNTWAIVRAVKAAEPLLRLHHASLDGSINWEWAPRLAVNGEMRLNDEHPFHPRSTWKHQAGPAHISEYWPWVEHRVREAYVRSRYEALAAMPDVFMDLALTEAVWVDGSVVCDLRIRPDLVGQEIIESLPARTAFSPGLMAALPGLRKAVLAVNETFDLDLWIGRLVAEFLTEHVTAADPEMTAIVSGTVGQGDGVNPFALTLSTLWNAVPEASGVWRLENGSVLTLRVATAADAVQNAGEESEAA